MANHPLNLALRFILELVALFSVGYWGWTQHQGLQHATSYDRIARLLRHP